MIRRAERPSDNFTIVRNSVLRDARLSYRARGLLVSILSRPDNWSVRSDQLAAQAPEGRDAVRKALLELRQVGYLVLEKRRLENGQFITEQVVYDFPVDNSRSDVSPETDFQASVDQAPVDQSPDSQASLEELSRRTVKKNISIDHSAFDSFWEVYPRRVNKGQARKAWEKAIRKAEPEAIIESARKFAELRKGEDPTFTPHPASWLNGERWLDEQEQKFVRSVTSREATIATVKEAMERLNGRRQLGDGT